MSSRLLVWLQGTTCLLSTEPTQDRRNQISTPSMSNLYGVLYTTKLALHYFVLKNGVRQSPDQEDTCLVLIGSGASFLDCPRGPQYSATKWGARGILHALRRVTHNTGTRVNMIAPW